MDRRKRSDIRASESEKKKTSEKSFPEILFDMKPTLERTRSSSAGPTLKPPLSPKSSTASRRRRHSSAESDDSINVSQAETVSDHSDMEIRISALQVSTF
jgi:hypothetical protein